MVDYRYKDLYDDVLVEYFLKQHSNDLKTILLSKDVMRHYAVVIEAPLLFDVCLELRDILLNVPDTTLPRFDSMLVKAANVLFEEHTGKDEMSVKKYLHVRIAGLIFYPDLNRHVIPRSVDTGLFVSISGVIARASIVQLTHCEKLYKCNLCKFEFAIKSDHEQFDKCKGRIECQNPDICSSSKVTAINTDDTNQWRDYQEVKLQERVQALSIGVIPRTIVVVLENDLVDSCKPGDDVTIVGIMCRRWPSCNENIRCHVQHQIIANHIQINNQRCLARITTDMQKYFSDFWSEYKNRPLAGRNEILQNLCPQIYGLFQVKLAVALVLAGGVGKTDESGTRTRGESHMLLIGDPGTGKSQFLKYAARIVPRSVFTTGIGSTSAGLTVSAVKDGGEWHLEAGALVLADGGLCCIDEFNSIKENDKSSILEAMEQQTISVAKAGQICKMNSRCTILAATNPKGKYDPNMSTSVNVAISSPLLSRFDLIFVLMDTKSDEWDELVTNYVLHGIQPHDGNVGAHRMNIKIMQSYFSIIKQLKPIPCDDAKRILQQYYLLHRKSEERNVARTTVRLYESVFRLAEAHAKLMFRTEVLVVDSIFAVLVAESSLGGLGLLEQENVLHSNFPENPDQLYMIQGELILKKLDLEYIWDKELTRAQRKDNEIVLDASSKTPDVSFLTAVLDMECGNPSSNLSASLSSDVHELTNENEGTVLKKSTCRDAKQHDAEIENPKSLVSNKTLKKLEALVYNGNNQTQINVVTNKRFVTSTPCDKELPNHFPSEIGENHDIIMSVDVSASKNNSTIVQDFGSLVDEDLTLDWL